MRSKLIRNKKTIQELKKETIDHPEQSQEEKDIKELRRLLGTTMTHQSISQVYYQNNKDLKKSFSQLRQQQTKGEQKEQHLHSLKTKATRNNQTILIAKNDQQAMEKRKAFLIGSPRPALPEIRIHISLEQSLLKEIQHNFT